MSADDCEGASASARVKLISQSDLLRDAFSELDSSCDRSRFSFFADQKKRGEDDDPRALTARFRLESQGSGGSTEVRRRCLSIG